MTLPVLARATESLRARRVLVRADFNVPISEGRIQNDFRVRKAVPTIDYLRKQGARIVLVSHIGSGATGSLQPVYRYLKEKYESVAFDPSAAIGEDAAAKTQRLSDGDILLFENLRQNRGEELNDADFAGRVAALGDVFVNEAFASSHRRHASIVGVPQHLPHYAGFLFEEEYQNLSRALHPKKPFYVIFGGAKFKTKLPLVRKFLPVAEKIFIGGALAHDLYAARGLEIGVSLVDRNIDVGDIATVDNIATPDLVLARDERGRAIVKQAADVTSTDKIVDAASEFIGRIAEEMRNARFILWNGPLGSYEEGFEEGTEYLAKVVAENSAFSIVGGGDTIAAIEKLGLEEKFGFMSTAGGAMLEFLSAGTLPGIEALQG